MSNRGQLNLDPPKTIGDSVKKAEPKLFWIGTSTSQSCKWPPRGSETKRGLNEFLDAVRLSSDRVWILDPHFEGDGGMEVIKEAVQDAIKAAQAAGKQLDLRVLTKRYKQLQKWCNENGASDKRIMYRSAHRLDYHDRYALLDHELWHFGSTVGGGCNDLSSATRGWYGHADDFSDFFKGQWEKSL